jgi:hypothetical protein
MAEAPATPTPHLFNPLRLDKARALQIALIGGALYFALTESERRVGECELVVKLIHDFNKVASWFHSHAIWF